MGWTEITITLANNVERVLKYAILHHVRFRLQPTIMLLPNMDLFCTGNEASRLESSSWDTIRLMQPTVLGWRRAAAITRE